MNGVPKISVLMTVYNAGRHLLPAINSILRQDFREFEFVIVDDASTDGSLEIVKEQAKCDSRVRVIPNEENKGQTACLNQGLRACRAQWIARQDADDLSLPGRLRAQWDVVRACPDLALVGVNGWVIDRDDHVRGMIHAPLTDAGVRWSLPWRNPFIHTGVVFRKRSGIFYDERFRICQDWDLWARVLETGRGCNLPARLVAYRHVPDSLSHAAGSRTDEESAAIVAGIWRRTFGGEPDSPDLLTAFRRGLRSSERREFWDFYNTLARRGGNAQAAAVHHMQVAGGVRGESQKAFLAELLAAFRADPVWTVGTIAQALRAPKQITT